MVSIAVKPERELDDTEAAQVTKRRQSSSPESSKKRKRLSTDGDLDSPSTLRASPNASPPVADSASHLPKDISQGRRESNVQEERKRGRRLFGGLLNTLSQSASNVQQKKRLEIEKRQQEKARLQKAEDDSRRAENLRKLKEVRMREQVKFDEQSLRIRHSNMLAVAQFLRTQSEPKLYYKPWKLLPGDAERISEQIGEAEAVIEREILDFNRRHKLEPRQEERLGDKKAKDEAAETEGEHQVESSSVPRVSESDSTNLLPIVQAQALVSGQGQVIVDKDPLEENGEVVVEGDEDTVIY